MSALTYLIEHGAIDVCELHDIPYEGGTSLEEAQETLEEEVNSGVVHLDEGTDIDTAKAYLRTAWQNNAAEECYACGNNRDRD
ncbi:MAG: hypothetical protein INR68_03365 [Methylobacterium mesophilicum]|nr:hypothetical protein [Methylobacterium mesophilicum]